jgi:hypothetical protein
MNDEEFDIRFGFYQPFMDLYNRWSDVTKDLFRQVLNLIHASGLDLYFTATDGGDLRVGVREIDAVRAVGVVGRLSFANNGVLVFNKWNEINRGNGERREISDSFLNDFIGNLNGNHVFPATYINQRNREPYWPNQYQPPLPINQNIIISLNTILYGPPGTGKTFSVIDYAHAITVARVEESPILVTDNANRDERKNQFDERVSAEQISFVTFHQSFSYEEFIEGIRAESIEGDISYSVQAGKFKSISDRARDNPTENYVLIIDEINRGNISKIFGELITLIESTKREGNGEVLQLVLPYSGELFSVPNNLYIIGTMNTADRSLALMDTALRRRFDFVEMLPKPDLLEDKFVSGVNIELMLETMNSRIEVLYDREHTLGHAFFIHLTNQSTISDLSKVFELKIIPLLQEYFFEDWNKIRIVLGDDRKINHDTQFVKEKTINDNLFTDQVRNELGLNEATFYDLNPIALINPQSYIAIYQ